LVSYEIITCIATCISDNYYAYAGGATQSDKLKNNFSLYLKDKL